MRFAHGRERKADEMAPKVTTSAAALEHVWGAVVDLIKELTALAANANRAIDEDRVRMAAKK